MAGSHVMRMGGVMIKWASRLAALGLASVVCLSAGSAWAQSAPDYDYSNWQSIPFASPESGTETYLRSYTETVDGTLTAAVIESFWLGGDGYMYVNVVVNNALVGSFRYEITSGGEGGAGPDYPPGDSGWAPPDDPGFYNQIPGVPEPGVISLLLAGGAVVLWRRYRQVSSRSPRRGP